MSSFKHWRAVTFVYAAAVLVVSLIPLAPELAPGNLDKVVHLCEYLLLAWLFAQASIHEPKRRLWKAWAWATVYGAVIEGIQAFVPWRSADMGDALLNAIGAFLGVLLAQRYSPAHQNADK